MPSQHILVTGGAGFIGSHLVDGLLDDDYQVTVIDNFDAYYPESIKRRNIERHVIHPKYRLVSVDIENAKALTEALQDSYDVVVHLAAKAGVRNSLLNPLGYQMTNIIGTQNLLTFAHSRAIKQFVYASSSSVYGDCQNLPWSENDLDLSPLNPYASTKLANEHLAHVYVKTFGLRCIGLRFFTVIGERQRPDLAIHKFARLMKDRKPIPVYGDGLSERDFTYWGDIVAGVRAAMSYTATDFEVFNLGNNRTISLIEMVRALEQALGIQAQINWQPWQPGEMRRTWADISKAQKLLNYQPATRFEAGLDRFVTWFRQQEKS